ncbi:MAG: GNAT family N-acetyltransferase [Clostridia bacterium]|nr:GNAT family N-acetyltransferase [Clostridia bacterium]
MDASYQSLRVRNACPEDAAQLCTWWNDGSVMAHAGFPHGLGTTKERIQSDLLTDTDLTRRRLIITYADTPIGEMSYRLILTEDNPRQAEIGIKICNPAFQNRGLGRQALSLLIVHLFRDLHCARIVLDTNLHNLRAQHVYESLGFVRLGVRENCFQDQVGQWQSAVDYALCPENFVSFLEEATAKEGI